MCEVVVMVLDPRLCLALSLVLYGSHIPLSTILVGVPPYMLSSQFEMIYPSSHEIGGILGQ